MRIPAVRIPGGLSFATAGDIGGSLPVSNGTQGTAWAGSAFTLEARAPAAAVIAAADRKRRLCMVVMSSQVIQRTRPRRRQILRFQQRGPKASYPIGARG